MLFWHLGATIFLFRWIFRDPKVDLRFLAAGALLPDVVDLVLGTLVFPDRFGRGELWSHTLLAPSIVTIVVLLATRRGRRRRAWMALAVGMFFHLLLDGMWTSNEVFLWPFTGAGLPTGAPGYWTAAWDRALSDPWRWVREGIGATYLTLLWIRSGLGDRSRRRSLLATGRLPEPSR
jgi:hypothetical protein